MLVLLHKYQAHMEWLIIYLKSFIGVRGVMGMEVEILNTKQGHSSLLWPLGGLGCLFAYTLRFLICVVDI